MTLSRIDSPVPIEDYALVGDTETGALVSRAGAIDWLCLPRFDSDACFAALLGGPEHGRWVVGPVEEPEETHRSYRDGTLVLETIHSVDGAEVKVIDFMPVRDQSPDIVRVVEGVRGTVRMGMELRLRLGYGKIVPWVRQVDDGWSFVAGPDALGFRCPVPLELDDHDIRGEFDVGEGDRLGFRLVWHPSHEAAPAPADPLPEIETTTEWWAGWSSRCAYDGPRADLVRHSLVTLKALTYAPTGGIVAAPTTSLPEALGRERNWDYRYCWVRDATFTLHALLEAGFEREAVEWRDWLLRAVAGSADEMQMLYGVAGERRLTEIELDWLPGYEQSTPVRVGNLACEQFQIDVYGEVMDVMDVARERGVDPDEHAWDIQRELLDFLERAWREPDEGIWEVRGDRRHFTHSKVMAWVAFDRGVKAVERHGLDGPAARWREIRDEIHDEVCAKAWDGDRGAFTQSYDSRHLDAALLMMPLVGFLPADDERMVATVASIRDELDDGGLVRRYSRESAGEVDELRGVEGAFLPCTFWLADSLLLQGDRRGAEEVFERAVDLVNDVGLVSEEYDTGRERMVGNFPQALTHVSLVNTAMNLAGDGGPAAQRAEG